MHTLTHKKSEIALPEIPSESCHALVTDPPAGIKFMQQSWDAAKGGRDQWIAWLEGILRECIRCLHPGGHGLVWALPRTSHWTATALEDAGFEIRDVITHIQSQSFPHALDVSKAIDQLHGAERERVKVKNCRKAASVAIHTRGYGKAEWSPQVDDPITDNAVKWHGWKTGLKPASEHWILVRKPIVEGNVARQVLSTGTGALNVGGCCVGTQDRVNACSPTKSVAHNRYGSEFSSAAPRKTTGRYPPNLILSHSEHCGDTCVDGCVVLDMAHQGACMACFPVFRHAAKATTLERNAGLGHLEPIMRHNANGGGGFEDSKCKPLECMNSHSCVKSLDLMQWLCRLVTPPGGTILDPFMGSGSTGCAAMIEKFSFVGIEMDARHFAEAEGRIRFYEKHGKEWRKACQEAKQQTLFG